MPEFGFVSGTYEAASLTQDAQECINWYPEVDPTKTDQNPFTEDKRGVIALYPTPGLITRVTPTYGPVRALYPVADVLLAAVNTSLYSIDTSWNASYIGAVGGTDQVSITDNGIYAYLADGANRYTYNLSSGAFATVTDGAFTGADFCDVLDNFIFYNRPGTDEWGCTDVGAVTSGALNLGQKLGSSDRLVRPIAANREIWLLGEKTYEVHVNIGSFPFPFAINPGTMRQHGIAAKDSCARLGESLAWLSKDDRGNGVVVQSNGYDTKRLSTHAMESAIKDYSTITDAIGYSYQQAGHEFYVLTFPSGDATWCFDLATGFWHKRAWRDSNNVLHRHRSNCAANFNGKVVVGDWENGKIYELSQSTYTDAGDAISRVRRAPHITTDLRQQFFHELQVQMQPGVGLQSGQGSNPTAMLRWSDDGGMTYGNYHTASIGMAGQYRNRVRWDALGEARDRVFELSVTDPINAVVVSSNLYASAGAI